MGEEWQAKELQYQRLQEIFEELPDATWELDELGMVKRANRKAVEAVVAGRMFRLRNGVLQCRVRLGFERVLNLVVRGEAGVILAEGYLGVRPARGGGYVAVYRATDGIGPGQMEAIQRCFGLTPAEVRLLKALLEGGGLSQASEQLGVSLNTAKTQLAALFAKTGTNRQSELVRLVSRLG